MNVSCIAKKQIVLQLMDNLFFYAERIDHHIVASVELNEIKASKGSSILVLVSAVDL